MFETRPVRVFGLRHNLSRTLPALAVSLASLLASPAMAATINVTANASDVLNGADGSCSLREAIYNINNGGASGHGTIGSGTITFADCVPTGVFGTNDTINIPAGKYTIAIPGASEMFNATGDYNIRKSVSIVGAGASKAIISGGKLDRVFQISSSATVTFSGVAIQDGNTGANGGGILNAGGSLAVTNSTITGNTAATGGGISCVGGSLAVSGSSITSNTAVNGGGVSCVGGSLAVSGSSITSNTAVNGGGVDCGAYAAVSTSIISGNKATTSGGGIINIGALTVTNSTITSNTAATGGGINNAASTGSATVTNSTITANSATTGGGVNNSLGTASFSNSIVANQISGGDCHIASGSIISTGHNIESSASCGFNQAGDKQNTNPLLGSLSNNGGPTMTYALLPGSPAANAGSCVQAADQRGVARPQGSGCDIGAFETAASDGPSTSTPGSTTPGVSTSPYINGASSSPSAVGGGSTVTITNSGSNVARIHSIGGAGFSVSGDNCSGQSIAANGTCQVTVTPASSATSPVTVTLLVYTDLQMAPVEISLKLGSSSSSSASSITLGSPADGSTTGSAVTFEWVPSGTGAYHLYLCQNMDFSGCDAIAVNGAATANRVLFAGAGLMFALGLIAPAGRRRMFIMAFTLTLATGGGLTACGSSGSSGGSGASNGNVTYTATNLASGTWYWKVATDRQQSETRTFNILAHSNRVQ